MNLLLRRDNRELEERFNQLTSEAIKKALKEEAFPTACSNDAERYVIGQVVGEAALDVAMQKSFLFACPGLSVAVTSRIPDYEGNPLLAAGDGSYGPSSEETSMDRIITATASIARNLITAFDQLLFDKAVAFAGEDETLRPNGLNIKTFLDAKAKLNPGLPVSVIATDSAVESLFRDSSAINWYSEILGSAEGPKLGMFAGCDLLSDVYRQDSLKIHGEYQSPSLLILSGISGSVDVESPKTHTVSRRKLGIDAYGWYVASMVKLKVSFDKCVVIDA